LGYDFDACFPRNGQSFIVRDCRDLALVFETNAGKRLHAIRLPVGKTNIIMSAALSLPVRLQCAWVYAVVMFLGVLWYALEAIHGFFTEQFTLV
jgi:hypothetical protein